MERKLILVVDDDADVRDSIREAFALAGYETVGAGDGFAALGRRRLASTSHTIRKPFELRTLLEAIDEALNQKCPNQCAA